MRMLKDAGVAVKLAVCYSPRFLLEPPHDASMPCQGLSHALPLSPMVHHSTCYVPVERVIFDSGI